MTPGSTTGSTVDDAKTGRKTRNTASPEDQESAIIAAAISEFTDVGVRRANMDVVAAQAGVSRSTLYRRFPNKDALLVAVAGEVYEQGMERLESLVSGLGPRDAVVEAFTAGAAMIAEDPLMRRLVITDNEMRGITSTVTTMFVDVVTERVSATLRRAGAEMPDEDLHHAVELHVRLVISYLDVPTTEERQQPQVVRELAIKFLAPMIW